MEPQGWGYLTIWEFRVKPGRDQQFERAYGPTGAWVHLFRTGDGYVKTELVRDLKQPGRYLTLDFWRSRTAYDRFREEHREEYEAIDARCEQLTETELHLGEFESITPPS